MRLSIVDLATVAPNTTEQDALADALAAVQHAEVLGYHRVWFAQHHLGRAGASHYPQLLIAAAAMLTSEIRLGSGAMLMNHHSPFTMAEMFAQLEAMAPGRVDLGIGRAGGHPALEFAIQQNREQRHLPDHHQQISEVLAWLHDRFPDDHPFAAFSPVLPSVSRTPQTWLLGSSPNSADLAAHLGIGYTFAGFIDPTAATIALTEYRRQFRPQESDSGLQAPTTILAVNVTVGDSDADGIRLANSVKGFYSRLRRGVQRPLDVTVPDPDTASRELSTSEASEPVTITDGRWPRFVAGSPDTVRHTLEQMIEESGADELMIQDTIADPIDRRRSHQLLAEAFDLAPRDPNRDGSPGL